MAKESEDKSQNQEDSDSEFFDALELALLRGDKEFVDKVITEIPLEIEKSHKIQGGTK